MSGARRLQPGLERGVAIVTVLLVLSILAMIGLGIATMGQGHMAITVAQNNSERAYMAAEAAAMYQLDEMEGISSTSNVSLSDPTLFTAPDSGTAGWPKRLSNLYPGGASDVTINATVYAAQPWKTGAAENTTVRLPGWTADQTITIPPEHAYVVGCGNVQTSTFQPGTVRYVGLMVHKAPPGGIFYFGAYANNTMNCTGNPNSVVDAWNSNTAPGKVYQTGAGWLASNRVPFADLVGAGVNTTVAGAGSAAGAPGFYGNADGPVLNTTGTDFGGMGSARRPGETLTMPTPPWPAVGPSPAVDLTVNSGQNVYIGPGAPAPLNAMQWDEIWVKSGGNLVFVGLPGTNFTCNELVVDGRLAANTSLMANGDRLHMYVGKSAGPGTQLTVKNGGTVTTEDDGLLDPNRNGLPKGLDIYSNAVDLTIRDTNSNVTGTIASLNPAAKVNLLNSGTLTGSIISAGNIIMTSNFNLHYDVALRQANTNVHGGAGIGIVSHQRL